jgi:glutathione S-transferase
MKLYFSPGACSFAPHVALHAAGVAADAVKVDLRSHKTADGADYYGINPKGYVPFLVLDDGSTLSEAHVILQYIADRKPGAIAPAYGTAERYKTNEWLGFVATEIHKAYSPLWHPEEYGDKAVEAFKGKLHKRYGIVEEQLGKTPYLAGSAFSIADMYLYTVTKWAGYLKVDLSAFPKLGAYMKRVEDLPAVKAAQAAERGVKQAA